MKVDKENLVIPCEVYSRVVGYFRPVQNWNKGKKQEFLERNIFRIDPSLFRVKERELVPRCSRGI